MLEGAKLAPVYERKRKHLMEQLLDLQGDTRREAPVKFESDDDDDDEEDAALPPSPVKRREKQTSEDDKKRESKLSDRMSKFEKPSAASGGRNFKYKTLEELKKRNSITSDTDKPDEKEASLSPSVATAPEITPDSPSPIPEEPPTQTKDTLEVSSKKQKKKSTPKTTPVSTPETTRKNRASSLAGGLLNKVKKIKHDSSKERASSLDASSVDNVGVEEGEKGTTDNIELDEGDEGNAQANSTTSKPAAPEVKVVEEEKPPEPLPEEKVEEIQEEEEEEDGKPLVSNLERVTRRLGRYSYQKIEMTLLSESVKFRKHNQSVDKSTEIPLVGAASAIRDSYQFELHTPDKSYTFRTDSEELCTKWVTALGEAIDICNPAPIEEEPEPEGKGLNLCHRQLVLSFSDTMCQLRAFTKI